MPALSQLGSVILGSSRHVGISRTSPPRLGLNASQPRLPIRGRALGAALPWPCEPTPFLVHPFESFGFACPQSAFTTGALPGRVVLGRVVPMRGDATRDAAPDVDATRDAAPGAKLFGAAGGGSASAIVTGWQPAALTKVTSTLGLTPKPEYSAGLGFDAFTLGGSKGKIESFEGAGKPNIAWCSGLHLAGGDVARGSVAAFCGPLTDVPHLIAACGVSNGGIDLYIDFRPRADGAYDLKYATLAAYPEPSTRDAFAKASNRKDFAGAYFTPKLEAWRAGLLALPGATPNAPLSLEHTAALSAGPMLLDLRLPLSDASASAAAAACTSAVDTWLHWMTHAEEMKRALAAGMRQTATYTRDTKVRQQHFGFLLGKYAPLFGEADGKALTKADAGPLDEAYVGGGS